MIQHLEEKFKNTLAHLDEKPSEQKMFNQFLALYPADWKLLKITFSKFNRSKQAKRKQKNKKYRKEKRENNNEFDYTRVSRDTNKFR